MLRGHILHKIMRTKILIGTVIHNPLDNG